MMESKMLENKRKFKATFDGIINSKHFKIIKRQLNLENFTFKIGDNKYLNQMIDFICYKYSLFGGTFSSTVFQLNLLDRYNSIRNKVIHLINTGFIIILIDKNNLVCSTLGFMDIFNKHYNTNTQPNIIIPTSDKHSTALKHKDEYSSFSINETSKKLKWFDIIYNNKVSNDKISDYYGIWCTGTLFCSRIDLRGKKVSRLMKDLGGTIMNHIGYKYSFGHFENPISKHYAITKVQRGITSILHEFNIKSFKFKDGTSMDNYFNDLKKYYNYNDNQINRWKNGVCYLTISRFRFYIKDPSIYLYNIYNKKHQSRL